MEVLRWSTEEEGRLWASALARGLKRPSVILLSGELGAGKTQIVKWILEALGFGQASSPTFAIHQRYESPGGPVDHVDLYRLTSDADLESSGFWDLFTGSDGLVFVEWADRLPESVWPAEWTRVRLQIKKTAEGNDEGREVTWATLRPRS